MSFLTFWKHCGIHKIFFQNAVLFLADSGMEIILFKFLVRFESSHINQKFLFYQRLLPSLEARKYILGEFLQRRFVTCRSSSLEDSLYQNGSAIGLLPRDRDHPAAGDRASRFTRWFSWRRESNGGTLSSEFLVLMFFYAFIFLLVCFLFELHCFTGS